MDAAPHCQIARVHPTDAKTRTRGGSEERAVLAVAHLYADTFYTVYFCTATYRIVMYIASYIFFFFMYIGRTEKTNEKLNVAVRDVRLYTKNVHIQ